MEELLKKIDDAYQDFKLNAKATGNKSAAKRAHLRSVELRSLLKAFRAESLDAMGQ